MTPQPLDEERTLSLLIVPFNTVTSVLDPPYRVRRKESFAPRAFAEQLAGEPRVWLNVEHEHNLGGIVGHCVGLRALPTYLHSAFRVHPGPEGDRVLANVKAAKLTGVSLECCPLKTRVLEGVKRHEAAHLQAVSLVRRGAYRDARVLRVRCGTAAEYERYPDPRSVAELHEWELERREAELEVRLRAYIDRWAEQVQEDRTVGIKRDSYATHAGYQGLLREREEVAAERGRAGIQSRVPLDESTAPDGPPVTRVGIGQVLRVR
jgi:HK97 family phage prohead protease